MAGSADSRGEVQHRPSFHAELRERSLGLVRLRWWVPPAILAGTVAGLALGAEFPAAPVAAMAAAILIYNALLGLAGRRMSADTPDRVIRRFAYGQVALDYAAMFALIHLTGGAASPLIFFFIFHVIFAAILLPPLSAYLTAGLVSAGMAVLAFLELRGRLPHHPLLFNGRAINLADEPFFVAVEVSFFAISIFIAAFSTAAVMRMLRRRMVQLAGLSETLAARNDRLAGLLAIIRAVGATRSLQPVLDTVTVELARVMRVQAVAIEFPSEDGKTLTVVASHGLPGAAGRMVEVSKSPLHLAALSGEPYARGMVSYRESLQYSEELAAAGIQSVLLMPLRFEGRVTGILSAYCGRPDRFDRDEIHFFRLAADIVAIAIENASAYESIERLEAERSRFMRRVTHNLRAPLAAIVSVIEVVRGGFYGPINDRQEESLAGVDSRARDMLAMITEVLDLARKQEGNPFLEMVDLDQIAEKLRLEKETTSRIGAKPPLKT